MERSSQYISGKWIANEEVGSLTNIQGRVWRSKDGLLSGVYTHSESIPREAYERGIEWYFTPEQCNTKLYEYFVTDFGNVPADILGKGFYDLYQQLCEPLPWWRFWERRRRKEKRKMMLDIVTEYAREQWRYGNG